MSFSHWSLWKPDSLLLFPLNEKACFLAGGEGNSLISYSSPWLHGSRGSLSFFNVRCLHFSNVETNRHSRQFPSCFKITCSKFTEKKLTFFFFFFLVRIVLLCVNEDRDYNSAPMHMNKPSWLIKHFCLHFNYGHSQLIKKGALEGFHHKLELV